jgi:glycosyltransferase involved in cell wall biosynthesis
MFHTIPGEGQTSSEVYGQELAEGLQRIGNGEIDLTHWTTSGRLRRAAGAVRPLARAAGYVDRYVIGQWRARGQDADVNHIIEHGYSHLAFSLNPRRTVVTFHDAILSKLQARELPVDADSRPTMLGNRLRLAAIRRVAAVITDSESSRNDFLRFTDYDPSRVYLIPLGVSERFRPVDRKDGDRGEERDGRPMRILHVGHCGVYKNIEGILRSIPLLVARLGPQVVFVKVGGPFTRSQLALIDRLGIEQHVQHLGMVPAADLPGVYADADLLLMPSLHEGFGLPALEAMACGTPVIASNQGSLPEVVGEAGLLVEPNDIEQIAAAAERLLTDAELRAELRKRGLERARTFTWERTARETLAVYRSVFDMSRRTDSVGSNRE